MKHRVAELEGSLLDTAVAKALADPRISMWGVAPWIEDGLGLGHGSSGRAFRPSIEWDFGGPIIERERIALAEMGGRWHAMLPNNPMRGDSYIDAYSDSFDSEGPTALIAAMRAYVASKFGDEVEL